MGSPGADTTSSPSDCAEKVSMSPGRDPPPSVLTASPFARSNPARSSAERTRAPEREPSESALIVPDGTPQLVAPISAASDAPCGEKNTSSATCNPSRSTTENSSPLKIRTDLDPPPGTGCRSTPLGRTGRPGATTPLRSYGVSKTGRTFISRSPAPSSAPTTSAESNGRP